MPIKSLSQGKYKSPRGQIIIKLLEGSLAGNEYVVGDTDFTRNITTEKTERYTNEFAVKTKALSEVDQVNAVLNITAYQSGLIAKMAAHMSEASLTAEIAASNLTETFENVDFNNEDTVLVINARRASEIVVSDGDEALFIEGVHYNVSAGESGKTVISIRSKPDDAIGNDVQVDYNRLASSADRYNFSSLTEILCEVIFIENVRSTAGRTPETHVYHRVGLTVDGDYQLIGSDSGPRTVTITGEIYPDTTKPEPLGYIEDSVKLG